MKELEKKHGMVVLMDALGARDYSEEKVKKFLSARHELNDLIRNQAAQAKDMSNNKITLNPITYTFGDTLVIVVELDSDENNSMVKIFFMIMIIQNYLFASMHNGILFRGAFSFGEYIDDEDSNTVMGKAVSDAASWYEKAEWFGVVSTPGAKNFVEYIFKKYKYELHPNFILNYPVPMKNGVNMELYAISWPGRFHQEENSNPELEYLKIISNMEIPFGTENKYLNSYKYFHYVTGILAPKSE